MGTILSTFSTSWNKFVKYSSYATFIVLAFGYILPKIYGKFRRIRINYCRKFKPKIIIIGAGLSGLATAIKLKTELNYDNFIILERQSDVGGTWLTNIYPGCACDVPSILYSYSFDQKHDWSKEYAPQSEILQYIKSIAKKYDLYKHIRFNQYAKLLKYDQDSATWSIHCKPYIANKDEEKETKETIFRSNILIQCGGGLTSENVKYPYSEKLKKFKGMKMHSGKWNKSYSWKDKTAALVGSGCSAIQIGPILQKQAKKLYVFQRSPTYIFPKLDYNISKTVHNLYYYFPFLMYLRRLWVFLFMESTIYPLLKKKNKAMQKIAINVFKKHRNKQIPESNEYLRNAVTPKGYTPGCKRMSISNEWFTALNSNNTELIVNTEDSKNCIVDFYDKGIILKDGRKLDVDAIAFATGYEVTKITGGNDIVGRDNASLCKLWEKEYGPYSYKGVVTHHFPNLFFILGPGSGVGSNSFLLSIEVGVDYVIKCIYDMMINDYKSVEIKKEVEEEYNQKLDKRMEEMIWTQQERSWYKLQNGRVHTLFGWGMFTWMWFLRKPNWNEFNIIRHNKAL